ncbi:MAG: DNA repair protein RecO [Chloroflexi bacterium]|nr:DNA repair protein RecO [Chloroflexota bacterium]MCL5274119.1 DNA repair protein RecO [Chloroflexota bacterium]
MPNNLKSLISNLQSLSFPFVMSRVRLYASEAIVIRHSNYGEADRILTIMTPELGKLRVIAKGVRKITSRKAGHVELFTRVRLLLARGRTFDIISQAETVEAYRPLREDLLRGSYAHYLSELIDAFAQEGSEDSALYDLLANGLDWVSTAPDPALAARYFELRLLTITGYRPQLFKCARTGEAVNVDAATNAGSPLSVAFSPIEGGILSPPVARLARDTFSVPVGVLRLLRVLQTQPFDSIKTLDVSPVAHAQAEQTMRRYLTFVLERTLRSTYFLRQLVSEDQLNSKPETS